MSQKETSLKKEKKNRREKKNKADRKYNKTDKEQEILNDLINEWLLEGYRSPNKEEICKKYLQILHDNNFTNYTLRELKEYCNNHRKKQPQPNNPQNLIQNVPQITNTLQNQQQVPRNLSQPLYQPYPQQEKINLNQIQHAQSLFQPMMQPPAQTNQNFVLQQPIYTQQQVQLNQSFPQQASNSSQQKFPFNQACAPQQSYQSLQNNQIPQQEPLNNQAHKQQIVLQPINEQKHITSIQNQTYFQQQKVNSLPSHIFSQQQATPQALNQANAQQDLIQSQNQNIQLCPQQGQQQPNLINQQQPISPEMSEIQLPSDSIGSPLSFFSDSSQFPSRTSSISIESNTSNSQVQYSSAFINSAQNTEINTSNTNNEFVNSEAKNENKGDKSLKKEEDKNDAYNEYDEDGKDHGDETDSEDGTGSDDDLKETNSKGNSKTVSEKSSKKNIPKRVILCTPHGGKQVGKTTYFPPDSVCTSYSSSSSSPYSVSLSSKLQSSADKKSNEDDLIKNLPEIPIIGGELNEANLDTLKSDLYRNIKICYQCIHHSSTFYRQTPSPSGKIIFNEQMFNFQKDVERRFVSFSNLIQNMLHKEQIGSRDPFCEHIDLNSKKHMLSTTTRIYNGESLSDSITPFRTSSEGVSNTIEKEDCNINSYIHKISRLHLNEKLSSFYLGKYDEETRYSFDIRDVEASDIISYTYNSTNSNNNENENSNNNDNESDDNKNIIFECAYVKYYGTSHVLELKGVKSETGFYGPVTSMHFHHYPNSNKIYLCGDVRVKEFTIYGLEDKKGNQNITIKDTATFHFGKENYKSSAVTVWEKELVLAVDSKIYFWNIEDDLNIRKSKEKLDTKANRELVKNCGLDIDKIDWTHGKHCKSNQITITTAGMQKITALEVIKDPTSGIESYLAVCSNEYPVIYIYNQQHQNISRLVAHTMGVTCLKSVKMNLFSGSYDLIARLWSINEGAPVLWCNTKSQRITAIEAAVYCDKLFLFTGGEDNTVQCFSITDKRPVFEIELNSNLVPRKISFIAGNNKKVGDHAKLMIISECEFSSCMTTITNYQVHYFDFI